MLLISPANDTLSLNVPRRASGRLKDQVELQRKPDLLADVLIGVI